MGEGNSENHWRTLEGALFKPLIPLVDSQLKEKPQNTSEYTEDIIPCLPHVLWLPIVVT